MKRYNGNSNGKKDLKRQREINSILKTLEQLIIQKNQDNNIKKRKYREIRQNLGAKRFLILPESDNVNSNNDW